MALRINKSIAVLLILASSAHARIWTDATGKHRTSADLSDFQGGIAYLTRDDGQTSAVPIAKLSKDDQGFIRSSVPETKVIEGKVIGIADGDTLTILQGTTPVRIRLAGIDAPEGHQAFGTKAKQALAARAYQKHARIEWRERDRYGRTVGQVFIDGRWVNRDLVREGFAWHYRDYSKSPVLTEAESDARTAKAGLWLDDDPIPPWDFRLSELKKQLVEPKAPVETPKVETPPPPPLASADDDSGPTTSGGGTVHVKGYYRKNGTYVRPHTRSSPRR